MEITSVNNDLVKETVKLQQKKYRAKSGKFLLEGYKPVFEAANSGIKLEHIFVLKDRADKYDFIKQELILTNEPVLKKISTTDTAPDVVAVGVQPAENKEVGSKVILLENISDAGNFGTIVRSAVAFGIDTIVLYGDTVDVYNPKCVRSAVGNLWKVNIIHIKEFEELNRLFKDYERVATLPKTDNSVWLKDWRNNVKQDDKVLVMFGSEADGLSQELKDFATQNLTIEMSPKVESLNLSTTASIIMYEMMG